MTTVSATPLPTTLARLGRSALLAAIVFAGITTVSAQDAPDLAKVQLTIGIQSSGSSAANKILEASEVFKDTPYTLNWANFDGANAAVEALHAGAVDVDVGLNFSTPVLNQANASTPWTKEDRPYVIIGASKALSSAGTAIVVHANSGINSVNDLAGKKVSFAKGTANHYFFAIAAKEAGLDLAKVELVLIPLSEARAAYVGGSVDALVTSVSNARPLISSGESKVLADSAGLYDSYSWLVARPQVLADAASKAAIDDILIRLQKAEHWAANNKDRVAQIYVEISRQSPADAALNAAENTSAYVLIDAEVIAANQRQADVFLEAGVAKTRIDAAIGFDDRFNDIVAANPGPTVTKTGSTN